MENIAPIRRYSLPTTDSNQVSRYNPQFTRNTGTRKHIKAKHKDINNQSLNVEHSVSEKQPRLLQIINAFVNFNKLHLKEGDDNKAEVYRIIG